MPGQALEGLSRLHELADFRVGLGQLTQPSFLGQRFLKGDVELVGHQLRHPVYLSIGDLHDASDVPDRRFGPKRPKGDDLAHVVVPIFLDDVVDHLSATVHAEIHIDIGHADPLGIQKPLEEEVIVEGIDVRDAQGISHEAAGRRSSTGPHGDATGPGKLNDVPDDQEIARVPHGGDDQQFFPQPLPVGFGRLTAGDVPQTVIEPFLGECFQITLTGVALRNPILGEVGRVKGQGQIAFVGDPARVQDGLGQFMECGDHFLRGLHVELIRVEPQPIGVIQGFSGLQTEHHVMGTRIFFLQIMTVIGPHERDPQLLVDLDEPAVGDQLMFQPVGLHLQIIPTLSKNLLVFAGDPQRPFHVILTDQVGDLAA